MEYPKDRTHTQCKMTMNSNQMTCVSLRTLESHEEKPELDKWWTQMKCHLAHPQLTEKMAGILHSKLENQDVASLKDIILERGQTALEELESSHASVNRINQRYQQPRPQPSRGYQPRPAQGSRPFQRQNQRTGGGAQAQDTGHRRPPELQGTLTTSAASVRKIPSADKKPVHTSSGTALHYQKKRETTWHCYMKRHYKTGACQESSGRDR